MYHLSCHAAAFMVYHLYSRTPLIWRLPLTSTRSWLLTAPRTRLLLTCLLLEEISLTWLPFVRPYAHNSVLRIYMYTYLQCVLLTCIRTCVYCVLLCCCGDNQFCTTSYTVVFVPACISKFSSGQVLFYPDFHCTREIPMQKFEKDFK